MSILTITIFRAWLAFTGERYEEIITADGVDYLVVCDQSVDPGRSWGCDVVLVEEVY